MTNYTFLYLGKAYAGLQDKKKQPLLQSAFCVYLLCGHKQDACASMGDYLTINFSVVSVFSEIIFTI